MLGRDLGVSKRTRERPPWLNDRVKEAIRGKKTPFKNGESNPSKGSRKEHHSGRSGVEVQQGRPRKSLKKN